MHAAISKHCFRATAPIGFNMDEFVMTNDHEQIEMLLPWFVTGQLDADEIAQVDAHVFACPECRLLLEQEYQLKNIVTSMAVDLPRFDMPANIVGRRSTVSSRAWQSTRQAVSRLRTKPMRVAAFAAAQAAMLLIVFQLAQPTAEPAAGPAAEYRTLSSGEVAGKANALVVFSPDTREADFREILIKADANIVGGPIDGNAYYLMVDITLRDSTLEILRGNPKVLLAQPIDGE